MEFPQPESYMFVFVCHGGRLEIESLLLLASLNQHLRLPAEIVAAIPTESEMLPAPDQSTIARLIEMGVRIESFSNDLLDSDSTNSRWYLRMANKIYCLRVETSADKIIFVDSDRLLLSDYEPTIEWSIPLVVRAQDTATAVCLSPNWEGIFSTLNMPQHPERVRVTGGLGRRAIRRFYTARFQHEIDRHRPCAREQLQFPLGRLAAKTRGDPGHRG
jgi:hypothetical protein